MLEDCLHIMSCYAKRLANVSLVICTQLLLTAVIMADDDTWSSWFIIFCFVISLVGARLKFAYATARTTEQVEVVTVVWLQYEMCYSVNKIASLSDFQFCRNLQELYVRKNNIKELNQILYLQDLPRLKSLWLEENPCADTDL